MINSGIDGKDCENTATKTAANAIPGKLIMMSMIRMRISETTFPAVAAMDPRTDAITRANSVAPRPMTSEPRAP